MPENQTLWKFNNQRLKEEIFIQMGRRGRDREPGWRGCRVVAVSQQPWRPAERQSDIHVWWIKIRRDTLGAGDPSPRPDCAAQGSSAGKIKPHNFWL